MKGCSFADSERYIRVAVRCYPSLVHRYVKKEMKKGERILPVTAQVIPESTPRKQTDSKNNKAQPKSIYMTAKKIYSTPSISNFAAKVQGLRS